MRVRVTGVLLILLSTAVGSEPKESRFVQTIELGSGFTAVLAEGDCEPRSIGTYAVRVYRDLKVGDYVAGVIRLRDGFVARAWREQGDSAGQTELSVQVETAGSGPYWRVDRFQFDGERLTLKDGTQGTADGESAKNQEILQQWNGDYPVSALGRIPKEERKTPVGYIGDASTFASVWQAFMPGVKVPEVDFAKNLVLFARNVRFYNRTSIAAVKIKDGVLDVIAIETMSSQPIKDKVAFAMVVVSRDGATSLKAGDELLPISTPASTRRERSDQGLSYALE